MVGANGEMGQSPAKMIDNVIDNILKVVHGINVHTEAYKLWLGTYDPTQLKKYSCKRSFTKLYSVSGGGMNSCPNDLQQGMYSHNE